MTKFVCGFAFEGQNVALIRKKRPEWQAGLLNGIGGHVEHGETFLEAMVREFREETGYSPDPRSWIPFAEWKTENAHILFYKAYIPMLEDVLHTTTDEKVEIVPVRSVTPFNCLPNLVWLISMAVNVVYDGFMKDSIFTLGKREYGTEEG